MADPLADRNSIKKKREDVARKVMAPELDLSPPPLEGVDPEWDRLKGNLRSQSFVGSDKFNKMVRSAWGAYQRGKAFKDRGDILPFNLRGKLPTKGKK